MVLRSLIMLLVLLGVFGSVVVAAEDTASVNEGFFAKVNDRVITKADFAAQLQAGMRDRFYHGTPPESEIRAYEKEVAESLIVNALLVQEAKRRGVEADADDVSERLKGIQEQLAGDPEQLARFEAVKDEVAQHYREKSAVERLEGQVKDIPDPTNAQVYTFYKDNPQLFTTPQKNHVMMILLNVDPSSPSEQWRAAEEKAVDLLGKIRAGGDFATLARIHSGDDSAATGGDMGFLHKGMLGDVAQQVLDLMAPGDISEPALLLEGVAIFKLVERTEPQLNPFESVEVRAKGLLKRSMVEQAWSGLIADLKSNADIQVNAEIYPAE